MPWLTYIDIFFNLINDFEYFISPKKNGCEANKNYNTCRSGTNAINICHKIIDHMKNVYKL